MATSIRLWVSRSDLPSSRIETCTPRLFWVKQFQCCTCTWYLKINFNWPIAVIVLRRCRSRNSFFLSVYMLNNHKRLNNVILQSLFSFDLSSQFLLQSTSYSTFIASVCFEICLECFHSFRHANILTAELGFDDFKAVFNTYIHVSTIV